MNELKYWVEFDFALKFLVDEYGNATKSLTVIRPDKIKMLVKLKTQTVHFQSTISSSNSVSQVGNMLLRNDIKNVNKAIEFLKSYTLEKHNYNRSQTTTRQNSNKKSGVKNFYEKVIECLPTFHVLLPKHSWR